MKYWHPQNWSNTFEHEGLLFFVQRIQEMLFHYSDDIHRAPIHNTSTLAYEFCTTYSEVMKGTVKSYLLDPIFEELKYSLKHDKILRDRFGDSFVDNIHREICSYSASTSKLYNFANYIYALIRPEYCQWTASYLKKHIQCGNHKTEIEAGVRSWVSDTIMSGYAGEFIYDWTKKVFIAGSNVSLDSLNTFFDRFDYEERKYKVYFLLHNDLSDYFDMLNERLSVIFDDDGNFPSLNRVKNYTWCYVECKEYDHYNAARSTYNRINTFLRYYYFFINNRQYVLDRYSAVWDEDNEVLYPSVLLTPAGFKSIMFGGVDDAVRTADSVILGIQSHQSNKVDINVGNLLNRALEFHNSAIRQQMPKDGFINLWSVLEVLCPKGDANSQLDAILYSILPVLQKDYYASVFHSILIDIEENLSAEEFKQLLDSVDGDGDLIKIASFCLLPEYEELREEYFQRFSMLSVLRHKIFSLYQLKEQKEDFYNLSQRYIQRVKWHLYRLYRMRNLIIHAGANPKEIQVLGEHLHSYVDRVVYEVAGKIAQSEFLSDVGSVFVDTTLLLHKIETLFSTDGYISSDEIGLLLSDYFCD